jgi:hypothetical protein
MNDPKNLNVVPEQKLDAPTRTYVKPAITYRAPLEATAGDCSSATRWDINCTVVGKASSGGGCDAIQS